MVIVLALVGCTLVGDADIDAKVGTGGGGGDSAVDSASNDSSTDTGGESGNDTGPDSAGDTGETSDNAAPSAPTVRVTPSEPTDSDALFCEVMTASVDPDGDAVTYAYAWSIDGVPTELTSTSVSADLTTADQAWTCSVTASDGTLTSTAGNSTITIRSSCGTGAVTHTASGVDFVTVCAQTFEMGCTPRMEPCGSDETLHTVTLTHEYYVGHTEVTQGQFRAVMGYNPSAFPICGDDCPVEQVSWHEAAAYTNEVSAEAELDACYDCSGSGTTINCDAAGDPYICMGYRLLTEAEWEAAARCGEDYTYAGSNVPDDVAWYYSNASSVTHESGTRYSNACGIFDMTGNVWEWSDDLYDAYISYPDTDPTNRRSGSYRVYRGGSWANDAWGSRVARRDAGAPPAYTSNNMGFRLARTAP